LIIGEGFNRDRLDEIAMETLGHDAKILRPEDVGLNLPDGSISFEEIAAPAALASLALR
jgi:hypothetical protein